VIEECPSHRCTTRKGVPPETRMLANECRILGDAVRDVLAVVTIATQTTSGVSLQTALLFAPKPLDARCGPPDLVTDLCGLVIDG
jgi:hypothetical protein